MVTNVLRSKTFEQKEIAVQQQGRQTKFICGWHYKWIKFFIWTNIFWVMLSYFKNPISALKKLKQLKSLRNQYREQQVLNKYVKVGNRYFFNYNAPGWPSKSFNRYIRHLINEKDSLHTIVFAITKKCGFQCEHCCEWENLNKPEVLEREDLSHIIYRFKKLGVAQIQLSGGEPLNRFHDILHLLDEHKSGVDFWLYTSGYQLTREKAVLLKQHGLTGITVSLDHHEESKHDVFRAKPGSFRRALSAATYAVDAGLTLTFSICATKEFIEGDNLLPYLELAKNQGASFVQILEPKAVGHYAGLPVLLEQKHFKILEDFYQAVNFSKQFLNYPIVTYHGFYNRRIGCSGSGKDYLYVDTDGDVHSCPFCQKKMFSALNEQLPQMLNQFKKQGCSTYNSCSVLKK